MAERCVHFNSYISRTSQLILLKNPNVAKVWELRMQGVEGEAAVDSTTRYLKKILVQDQSGGVI